MAFEEEKRIKFVPIATPLSKTATLVRFPTENSDHLDSLSQIWDEVVHEILSDVVALSSKDESPLHIDLREEMIFELAKLQLWLSDAVVEKRTKHRNLAEINVDRERDECLGTKGKEEIFETAAIVYTNIWNRFMEDRWKPKSKKALDPNTRKRSIVLSMQPVTNNHFISKWLIKSWAENGRVLRFRRTGKSWQTRAIGYGSWGYEKKLYSDGLEAYFALMEGDAREPVRKLIGTEPLNRPQRTAFVAFLVVHFLRNPIYRKSILNTVVPLLDEPRKVGDISMALKAYEHMFKDNNVFNTLASPMIASEWAILRSVDPIFPLPDTFGLKGMTSKGLRMIVPLSPRVCFVSLLATETESSIVPKSLYLDRSLASRVVQALTSCAASEFIVYPDFIDNVDGENETLENLLVDLEAAILVNYTSEV